MAAGLVACGGDSEVSDQTAATVPHVGELPVLQTGRDVDGRPVTAGSTGAAPASAVGEPDQTDAPTTAGTVAEVDGTLGAVASGNRLLALGDSITAAIGPQFGGQLCDVLEDRGWYVGVDAVQGRALDAGLDALDDIRIDEWDAAIVNLGANYRGDAERYASELEEVLDALEGRPSILVTVSEFEADISEVNYVIRDVARDRDDVWVLEWSEVTAADDGLTGSDRLHLSEEGRDRLADMLAESVGDAPDRTEQPDCVRLRNALPASSPNAAADDGSD